jgi:hypothetical protein
MSKIWGYCAKCKKPITKLPYRQTELGRPVHQKCDVKTSVPPSVITGEMIAKQIKHFNKAGNEPLLTDEQLLEASKRWNDRVEAAKQYSPEKLKRLEKYLWIKFIQTRMVA